MKNIKRFIVYPFILLVLFSACEDFFQEPVAKDQKEGAASLSDLFARNTDELDQLPPPAQVYAADGQHASSIMLSWSPVPGAASFLIERAVIGPEFILEPGQEPGDEYFDILDQFVQGTLYTDVIITDPQPNSPEYQNTYYYRIYAENTETNIESSPPSDPVKGNLFPPPSRVKASLGKSEETISVGWDKVDKAASYWIYRSDDQYGRNSYYVAAVQGNQNWYTDRVSPIGNVLTEQGKEYYYSVIGRNASLSFSISSFVAMGYALVEGAPGAVTVSRDGSGLGSGISAIKIKWDPPGAPGTYYYTVYRYSSEDSTLRLLTGKTYGVSYEDSKNLLPGLYYYYQVQAVKEEPDGSIIKGAFSEPAKAFLLSPPGTITAEKNGNNITLRWLPSINVDEEFGSVAKVNYTYKVEASNTITGPYTPLRDTIPDSSGPDEFVRADGLESFTFYRVITHNGSASSNPSEPVSPTPAAAVIQDVTKAANIPEQNPNTSGVYPVRITWRKPDTEIPFGYHIYRSSLQDSGFRKITAEPITAGSGEEVFSFIDTTNTAAKPGKRFYYRVLSLNMLGQGSNYSETLMGYGALTHEQFYLEFNKTVKSSHRKMIYMNKPGSTDKLGSETKNGAISGSLSYNASIAGLGARIVMYYENYADFYTDNNSAFGPYFVLTGNSNTSASMDQSGTMDGTINATGMYNGSVNYGNIQIKGGAAGGGTYSIQPNGFPSKEISWAYGE